MTLWSVVTLFTLWAAAAVVIDSPQHEAVRTALACAVLLAGSCLVFAALRERSEITARAAAAIDTTDFSARIREGLPPRPPPRGPRP